MACVDAARGRVWPTLTTILAAVLGLLLPASGACAHERTIAPPSLAHRTSVRAAVARPIRLPAVLELRVAPADSVELLRAEMRRLRDSVFAAGTFDTGRPRMPDEILRRIAGLGDALVRLATRGGRDSTAVGALGFMGAAHALGGMPAARDSAISYFARATDLARRAGLASALPALLLSRCELEQRRREDAGAPDVLAGRGCFSETLGHAAAVGDTGTMATAQGEVAWAWLRDPAASADSVLAHLAAAERLARATGDLASAGTFALRLGVHRSVGGHVDSTRAALARAVGDRRAIGDSTGGITRLAMTELGWQHHLAGEADSAALWLGRALAAARGATGANEESRDVARRLTLVQRESGALDDAITTARAWLVSARGDGDVAAEHEARGHLLVLHATAGRTDSVVALEGALRWPALPPVDHVVVDAALVELVRRMERSGDPFPLETGLRLAGIEPRRSPPELRAETPAQRERILGWLAANDSLRAATYGLAAARHRDPYDYVFRSGAILHVMDSLAAEWRAATSRGNAVAARNAAHLALLQAYEGRMVDSAIAWAERGAPVFTPEQRASSAEVVGLLLRSSRDAASLRAAAEHFLRAAAERDRLIAIASTDPGRIGAAERMGEVTRAWVATLLDLDRPWAALAALDHASARALRAARGDGMPALDDLETRGRALVDAAVRGGGTLLAFTPLPGDALAIFVATAGGELRVVREPVSLALLPALTGGARLLVEFEGSGGGDVERGLMLHTVTEATEAALALVAEAGPSVVAAGGARRTATSALRDVARTLLPPAVVDALAASRGVVTILAPGPLALVPFAALPVDDRGAALGFRHPIRIVPAIALLADDTATHAVAGPRAGDAPAALVVGDPWPLPDPSPDDEAPASAFARLPDARREAAEIGTLLGVPPLLGGEARERTVRERLPHASVVHLATHAVAYASPGRSNASFVALAPDDDADGRLSVRELLEDPALRLSAALVVISACESGLGELRWTEGTLGLQRALLARGARSTLVSLWRVRDDATRILMTAFYTHWLRDDDRPSAPEALRRAQADLRRVPGFEHPYYWAGFQIVGR